MSTCLPPSLSPRLDVPISLFMFYCAREIEPLFVVLTCLTTLVTTPEHTQAHAAAESAENISVVLDNIVQTERQRNAQTQKNIQTQGILYPERVHNKITRNA